MSAPIVGTGLTVWEYDPAEMDLQWSVQILDEMVAHPQFFSVPSTPDERREIAAAILTDTRNRHWGVWKSTEALTALVGVLSLMYVPRGGDALLHFVFFDKNLVGKRQLLIRFLGYCFTVLGLRRLSAEVPEDADQLLRFYRKLGFRFEGEHRASGSAATAFLAAGAPGLRPIENAPSWVARHGSRSEGAFWREDKWIDVLRLRLLRPEWEKGSTDANWTYRNSRRTDSRGAPRESPGPETEHHDPPAPQRSQSVP